VKRLAGNARQVERLEEVSCAIGQAGSGRSRGERRRTQSDWLEIERKRGISVSSSVMTFEFADCTFNLLDTPGHEDFSEDTYRTLTAVDSAVMVLDAAKGIEAQTRKLFEVCRLRDIPIITFVNKLDREALDPFALLDEIEETLQLEVTPGSWPIGMGQRFRGCFDLFNDRLLLMERGKRNQVSEALEMKGLADPRIDELLDSQAEELREGVEMTRELCPTFDHATYLEGNQTPVFFGSALNNFGVRTLLQAIADMAPPPRPQAAETREVEPAEEKVSGFVFKIQANMDPRHRDRLAFLRLCSGRFERGMKLFHPRSGKTLNIHNPVLFLAQDRERAEEAWAGDILGLPNHGNLHIGDALTEGEELRFLGIPSFAPELLRRVRPEDPLRAKHLGKALQQLAEEGAAQILKTLLGGQWIVGVAGALQFEVLADRIRTEYDIEVHFEGTSYQMARWVHAGDAKELKRFCDRNEAHLAMDHHDNPVFLAKSAWNLQCAEDDWPAVDFLKTREQRS
jgi:peptide chain release factor 3